MKGKNRVWLVCNAASGGNSDKAVGELRQAFAGAGLDLAHIVRFPDEAAPTPATLELENVDILAIFAGDGTTHSALHAAFGWSGPVLVLPGGTMNLLAKRLHGDVPASEIIARVGAGEPELVRPQVIRTRHGYGFSGMLAGPGATWNEVREAMRTADVIEMVSAAREAIAASTQGPRVHCTSIDGGREEGYAAITVTPHETGLEINGYYAESLGDMAGQGLALLTRDFRDGPHDKLGRHATVRIESGDGRPMELLIDGEPFAGGVFEEIALSPCGVDLLATAWAHAG